MNMAKLYALMPMILLSATAVVLMLQAAIKRNPLASWIISAAGLLAALWGTGYSLGVNAQVTPLLLVDDWGLFFSALVLVAATVTMILLKDTGNRYENSGDLYLLLILATLGAVVLVQASHMASLLLGLELLGISLYGMIAFPREGELFLEAAIKYLVLSAAASAILLFGFALLYAAAGDLSFSGLGEKLAQVWNTSPVLVAVGSAMVLVGLGFKLSVVPFHMWTPDVYQGSPTAVTGFLATVSKGAVFVVLARFFLVGELVAYESLLIAVSVLAIASMLVGNLLALRQSHFKRLLAYSSIAHFGYLLVVLVAADATRINEAVTFYLTAYIVTTLGAFSIASMIGGDSNDGHYLHNFNGLFWRKPLQAAALTIALLSLAGIPLTAGFVGKFYIINVGVKASLWWLIGALVVGSAIAIYYYLRVVFAMTGVTRAVAELPRFNAGLHLLTVVLMALMLLLGVWPQPFIRLAEAVGA